MDHGEDSWVMDHGEGMGHGPWGGHGSWHMGEDMAMGHCLIGGGEPRAAERKEDTQRPNLRELTGTAGRL